LTTFTAETENLPTHKDSVLFYLQAPDMSEDLINYFNASTLALVSFSIGYFTYDALDMLLYHRKRSSYELLIHHFLVILCFSIAATSGQYIAYAALSLIVEVNSVFLHTRQLFIITGEPKSSLRYKCNALLNVGTFLFFRILLLGWMTRWLTVHRNIIPLAFFTVGSIGLAVIVSA
jgi:TLC domain